MGFSFEFPKFSVRRPDAVTVPKLPKELTPLPCCVESGRRPNVPCEDHETRQFTLLGGAAAAHPGRRIRAVDDAGQVIDILT